MRTKTLLIVAASALAAAVTSSQAQSNVYSANVVGYINSDPPSGKYEMIANQLDLGNVPNEASSPSNTVNAVLAVGNVSSTSELLLWNSSAFKAYFYYDAGDSPDGGVGWYDPLGNPWGTTNYLQSGQGGFLIQSSGSPTTNLWLGQVVQGTNYYTIPAGYSVWAYPEPIAGFSLDSTQVNFPAVSSSDQYLQWNGNGYNVLSYYDTGDSPTGVPGWFTALGVNESTNPAYWPSVATSFFISHSGPPETWTNVFEVQ